MNDTEVKALLNKLDLTFIKAFRTADAGFKRSHVILCKNKKTSEQVVIKIFDSKDQNAKRRFIKEAKILDLLSSKQALCTFIPRLIAKQLGMDPIYYILEYLSYVSFGQFTD